jgi:hypothetical protein
VLNFTKLVNDNDKHRRISIEQGLNTAGAQPDRCNCHRTSLLL